MESKWPKEMKVAQIRVARPTDQLKRLSTSIVKA